MNNLDWIEEVLRFAQHGHTANPTDSDWQPKVREEARRTIEAKLNEAEQEAFKKGYATAKFEDLLKEETKRQENTNGNSN